MDRESRQKVIIRSGFLKTETQEIAKEGAGVGLYLARSIIEQQGLSDHGSGGLGYVQPS